MSDINVRYNYVFFWNVLIGQVSTNKSHSHGITDPGHSHGYSRYSALMKQSGSSTECWAGSALVSTGSSTTGITINSNGNIEARPENFTYKIWLRTA